MNEEFSKIDQPVTNFKIQATNNIDGKLYDLLDKNLVLFFYPKDNTPVCTSEAKAFRDQFKKFERLGTKIFGVSRDSLLSHEKFKERLDLPFDLISDTSEELCNFFNVIKIKNFFGKKIRGIVRSTFLIDANGVLRAEWRKVKVTNHVEEVLKAATNFL